jgi:hypothetical protein
MISDEELRRIQQRAQGSINDRDKIPIVLGMDPVMVFAMANELLHFKGRVRELEEELIHIRQAVNGWKEGRDEHMEQDKTGAVGGGAGVSDGVR